MSKVIRFPTKPGAVPWMPPDLNDLAPAAREALTYALVLELGALYQEMWTASDERRYEDAAVARDRIVALLGERR